MTDDDFHELQGHMISIEMTLRGLVACHPQAKEILDWLSASQQSAINEHRVKLGPVAAPSLDSWEKHSREFVEQTRLRIAYWEDETKRSH